MPDQRSVIAGRGKKPDGMLHHGMRDGAVSTLPSCYTKSTVILPRAFTLAEVVIVMLVISICLAVAVPRFVESMVLARVNAAARRICGDLAMAQAQAQATSSPQTVIFTVSDSASQYQITGLRDPDHPAKTYTVKLCDAPYSALLRSVACGGDTTLVFNGFGIPDSPGTIIVQVGQQTRTILIESDNGLARIQ